MLYLKNIIALLIVQKKIKELIEYDYSISIDNDEVFYLTLHISKLIV